MPRINRLDHSLYLSGASQVALNKNPIFPRDYPLTAADGKNWFNDNQIFSLGFSVNGEGFLAGRRIVMFILNRDGSFREIGERFGINEYCAGGNSWAVLAYDAPGAAGYTLYNNTIFPSIIPIDFSSDGWFAYKTQPTNLGLCLSAPGANPNPAADQIEPPNVKCEDVQLFPSGGILYRVGNVIKQRGLANFPSVVKTTVNSFGQLRAFVWQGEWWILYQENIDLGRSLTHPADELSGYVFVTDKKDCNRPDAAEQADTSLLIVYSDEADTERPGDIQTKLFNVTDPRVNFGSISLPPPSTGETMIASFERPMWQAPFFSHHPRYGDTSSDRHVGNAIYVDHDDNNAERLLSLGYPLIVNVDHPRAKELSLNLTIAWFVSGGSMQELEALVNVVGREYEEKPIIAYLDGRNWFPNQDWITDRVWPAIQAYRFPNEPLESFTENVGKAIIVANSHNRPMCLVSRFDDFNAQSTVNNILECMPHYEAWLRTYQFVAHMPFSDRRGNAIAINPLLWNQARAFQFAIPSQRPNRFDYWRPTDSSIKDILINKLGQSRAAVVLEPYLREHILEEKPEPPPVGDNEEPDINEPLLRALVEEAWDKFNLATEHNRGVALNWIGWRYNEEVSNEHVGLSRKQGGANVEQPHTGELIAHDIIQVKPPLDAEGNMVIHSTKYDVFSDTGAILGVSGEHGDDNRIWLPVVQP